MNDNELKRAGLSATQPRRLILDLLQQNPEAHLSAEEVYRRLLEQGETVGIATVYRVLGQFEKSNLINRHQFDGTTSVYELNQGKHHDHIICNECGRVVEFIDEEIEQRQRNIAEQQGFHIDSHLLYIFGHCTNPDCRYKP